MTQKDVALRVDLLAKRAIARKIAYPAIKTDLDVKLENENFNVLKESIYKEITKDGWRFVQLSRGEIYYITFPYTLDPKYPDGKPKFVLVLQEGEYFSKYDTVEILLITSDKQYKPREKYATDVEIPLGSTKLREKS